MRLILIICFLLAGGGMVLKAIPPISIEKSLSSEIKKTLGKADFSLVPVLIPDKFKVNGKFYFINSGANEQLKYAYMGRLITGRSGNSVDSEVSDFLDYIIFFSPLFQVLKVKIVRFNSAHGAEVCSSAWLKQFIGYTPAKSLMVGKNIDAISGATATVNGITFDIQSKTKILNEIEGGK